MVNVAVLGSTNGTSLQKTLDLVQNGELVGINICCVISNRSKSGILQKARDHNIPDIFLSVKKDNDEKKTLEEYDRDITAILEHHEVDVILLVGYMKLMSGEFVDRWVNRVLNIHPSLLPAFEGGMDLDVHQAVIDRGCKVTGASLIFIDHGADTGPIVSQRTVSVSDHETKDSLKTKVQALESDMLVEALKNWRDGQYIVDGRKVIWHLHEREFVLDT